MYKFKFQRFTKKSPSPGTTCPLILLAHVIVLEPDLLPHLTQLVYPQKSVQLLLGNNLLSNVLQTFFFIFPRELTQVYCPHKKTSNDVILFFVFFFFWKNFTVSKDAKFTSVHGYVYGFSSKHLCVPVLLLLFFIYLPPRFFFFKKGFIRAWWITPSAYLIIQWNPKINHVKQFFNNYYEYVHNM